MTALALAAIVVGVLLLLDSAVALPIIAIVFLAAAWEWAGFAGAASSPLRAAYVLAVGAAIAGLWIWTQDPAALGRMLWAAAAWWAVASVWLAFAARRGGRAVASCAGLLVLAPAAVALAHLVRIQSHGQALLLYLVVLVAAADVGAYFGGRRFGRRKLAPYVSPGKTWEGFGCGLLAAGLVGLAGALVLAEPWMPWLGLSLGVALISVIGDLAESMFKRRAGLKDSGTLLPGHGGVLDRIDSLTAAGPVFLLGLRTFGLGQ
jgi:phosphatidate cytidylyltransferase